MGNNSIPDRWLEYKSVGKPIEGTRFIAFKVPLNEIINNTIRDVETRFDIDKLLEEVPNLGMVIDLTNTTRYYSPHFFSKRNVKHIKLMLPGRQVPNNAQRDMFQKYVKNFLDRNQDNDKLVGVHCTHGLNRSGFLICSFMVTELKIDPKVAVERFEIARGHRMERENYIEMIYRLHKQPIPNGLDYPMIRANGNDEAINEGNSTARHRSRERVVITNWRLKESPLNEGVRSQVIPKRFNSIREDFHERNRRSYYDGAVSNNHRRDYGNNPIYEENWRSHTKPSVSTMPEDRRSVNRSWYNDQYSFNRNYQCDGHFGKIQSNKEKFQSPNMKKRYPEDSSSQQYWRHDSRRQQYNKNFDSSYRS